MIKNIKNIVFDFGGVLLDIDYQRTYESLSTLLDISFDPNDLPNEVNKVLLEFETGQINAETFVWNLQRLAIQNIPQGVDVVNAWNAMLIGWNPNKFEFLRNLKKKYKVYLLSNTNELHLTWVYNDLKNKHKITDFDTRFFNKTYYSHKLGMKKPEKNFPICQR
ncbi:MAG: hypothetical protein IPO92_04720 [Saprospiraceae bacterium]|nr:hypothetical protein [Saprospiraceae bacterium]